jgi:hypothetical protein
MSTVTPVRPEKYHPAFKLSHLEGERFVRSERVKGNCRDGLSKLSTLRARSFLDRIRQSPEFIEFMSEQKAQWEKYRQEFGG